MDKWQEYGSYENWKESNYSQLKRDYIDCEYERRQQYENPSFDDFCMGKWQWL